MQKFSGYFKILFLIILSSTPVFWFLHRPGVLIDGVDTNFPLDPSIWFHRRFFVWTAVSNGGADFSASTAGTFFHFLQFLPFKLGFPLQFVELFSFLFWFSLIVFSSWYLSKLFFPKKSIPQIIFVVLYSLNIWFFNSWENVKVANLALAAAIPLGASILLLLRGGKIKRGTAAVLSILTGIILAGAGINPAYIICFFVILTIFYFSEVFIDFGDWKKIEGRSFDFVLVSVFIILVNAFWILPSLNFIFGSITSNNSIGALGFTDWVNSLSENTSFVNVLRMQGAWDWYTFDSVTGIPLYIPYALKYFYDPLFIGFSFLVPVLAFLAYFVRKSKYNLLYISFGIMLVAGSFLTQGTHLPTGILFNFFVRHVPFFSLFRSPWYIFAPLVGLSVAGLVSVFFDSIYSVLPKRIVQTAGIILIAGFLVYSYPLLLGKIYRPASPNGFYIKFPDYVYQVKDYLAKTSVDGRILSYPDDNIEKFKWGYSGTDSILNLFSDKEVIFSPLNDTSSPLSVVVAKLYQSLKKGQLNIVSKLAEKLDINQIFYKKDQDSLSPSLPKQILNDEIASFGKWGFYRLTETSSPKIKIVNCCSLAVSSQSLSLIGPNEVLVNPNDQLLKIMGLGTENVSIIQADNSQISEFNSVDASLKSKLTARNLDDVEFDFDIPHSGSYSPILERYGIGQSGVLNGDKLNLSIDNKGETWILTGSDDSYLYFAPVNIDSGKHVLNIKLIAKNLVSDLNFVKNGSGTFGYSNGVFTIFNQSDKDIGLNFPVANFDPYSYYLIGVTYEQTYGNNAQLVINQKKGGVLFKSQAESMPNYPDWQNFSFYYSPVESVSDMIVQLEAPQVKDPLGTKVQYKNLSVYKVFSNNLFFKENLQNHVDSANVSFTENSPVSYSGRVTNANGRQVILFDENYSPNWQLNISGNPRAKIFHFTGNYYANAWYVEGPVGTYSFSIYYKPQSLLKLGYVIAGISVLGAVVYFGYHMTRRKNGK